VALSAPQHSVFLQSNMDEAIEIVSGAGYACGRNQAK
jgi:hypothetical protein